jgi:hypothetical protein
MRAHIVLDRMRHGYHMLMGYAETCWRSGRDNREGLIVLLVS